MTFADLRSLYKGIIVLCKFGEQISVGILNLVQLAKCKSIAIHHHIARSKRARNFEAVQAPGARESDISLAMSEHAAIEIDIDIVEC